MTVSFDQEPVAVSRADDAPSASDDDGGDPSNLTFLHKGSRRPKQ
jgi:hypothetical protein